MSETVERYLEELNTSEAIKAGYRQWGLGYGALAMGTIILAMLATLLSTTIINVAIPQIMGTYGIGQDKAQWLSTANLAAATVGMLMSSWMVSTWGMRNAVLSIMSLFTFGSIIGALSPNLDILIFARVLQGLTSGQIAPLAMSVIFLLFPARQAGMVMGVSSIGAILAPALGPTLGGTIIDTFNWRYMFILSIPVSSICLIMAVLFLPDRDESAERVPFDWLGCLCLSGAITLMLLGLSNGEREGWHSDFVLLCLASSATLWILFIVGQIRSSNPLLNLNIFTHRSFTIYSLTAFVFGAGLFGSTYLIPLFLQLVQGSSPTNSGLAMMPAGIAIALAIPLCGRLADHYDPRILISLGILFFSLSFYLMQIADTDTSFWTFAWWTVIGRIGIGLAIPAMNLGALKSVPIEMIGQAAGVLSFSRQLGGAFGVNLLSVVIARRSAYHADSLFATQGVDNATSQEWLSSVAQGLQLEGLSVIESQASAAVYLARALHHQATTLSFQDAFLLSAVVFLVTLIPAMMLGKALPQM